MTVSLDIDPALLRRAREAGGHPTESDAVDAALRAYAPPRGTSDERLEGGPGTDNAGPPPDLEAARAIIALFGTIDLDPDYDYKQRRRDDTAKRVPADEPTDPHDGSELEPHEGYASGR